MDYHETIMKRGLKKGWVAQQIGISQVLFSYYLNKTRPMPDHIKSKLEKVLA